MSSTPSPVLSRVEYDVATAAMSALRYGDLGVTPALLDADTDHEQRVLVLTVDIPGDGEHEAPVAIVIQGGKGTDRALYERLTHPGEPVTLEDEDEDSEGVA